MIPVVIQNKKILVKITLQTGFVGDRKKCHINQSLLYFHIPPPDELRGLPLEGLEVEGEELLRVVLLEPGKVGAGRHEGVAEGEQGGPEIKRFRKELLLVPLLSLRVFVKRGPTH